MEKLYDTSWWISVFVVGIIVNLLSSGLYEKYKKFVKPINDRSEADKAAVLSELTRKAEFLRKSTSDYYEFRLNKIDHHLSILFNFGYVVLSVCALYFFRDWPKWMFLCLFINSFLSLINLIIIRMEFKEKQKLQKRYDELENRGDMPNF